MLPAKTEPVPSVAELPTCQKTLHSWAPLISVTVLLEPVISVESVWKMKTEVGSPAPSSTSGPGQAQRGLARPGVDAARRMRLARSAVVVASSGRPAALT